MNKIQSFQIDHNILEEGFYLSRKDGDIFTYDLRFKKPNGGVYLTSASMHTIEHLMATVFRNSELKDNVIYFGPMGCRTGFYLLVRNMPKDEAFELTKNCIALALSLDEIPGSKKIECGNFRSHNLKDAKLQLENFLSILSSTSCPTTYQK